jgi:hypothetical protein
MIAGLILQLAKFNWGPWAAGALAVVVAVGGAVVTLQVHDRHVGEAAVAAYQAKQGKVTEKIIIKTVEGVGKTQIEYRDRIKVVYQKGERIETLIPQYIQPVDDARFAVNAGFVRIVDASWAGEIAGPASSADREPSEIPISEIARTEAANATSCLAWREQVLGWRTFYAREQAAINGKAGEWYEGDGDGLPHP